MTQRSNPDSSKPSENSSSNGLIERIVENWLTNASERSFQIPFCQLLSAQGEHLLYIATHGPFEKGKDVITRAPSGRLRGYQLKGGDIKSAEWREIKGQINNLVEMPIRLPSVQSSEWHEPFLVTNGRIEDTVLDYINTENEGWKMRHFPYPLGTIEKSALVRRFTEVHGGFLPKESRDFRALLALVLRDGRAPLAKGDFSALLETTLDLQNEKLQKREISRAIASSLLLTTYILGTSEGANNHWAIFEAWTIVCSYILCVATKNHLAIEHWKASYDLAMLSADRAIESLVQECKERTNYVEGNPLGDGYFYGSRMTLLAGIVAAWALNRRRDGEIEPFTATFLSKSIKQMFLWGEGATPYVVTMALEFERQCRQAQGERLLLDLLSIICTANERGRRGFPDPFVSIEDSLIFFHDLEPTERTSYAGTTYSVELAVEYLARRLRRQALSARWRGLTRLSLMQSIPQLDWEWLRWRAEEVDLASRPYPEPQSWAALSTDAAARSSESVPRLLRDDPKFLSYFLLVFPHRLNVSSLVALENAFGAAAT